MPAAAAPARTDPPSHAAPWGPPGSPWPAPRPRGEGRPPTPPEPPPEPERPPFPAAAWLAVLGAVLVLVGAAAFTASRWDLLPGGVKLGLLWGATGAVLALGAQVRTRLPLSGAALFHVGVLLVPVSAAATALGAGGAWPSALLAAGVVGAPVAWVLGWQRGYPVLEVGGVVLLGVGLAGASAMGAGPLGVLLAVAALAAAMVGLLDREAPARRAAWTDVATVVWALAAAVAPVAGLVVQRRVGSGTAARLGLLGPDLAWAAPLAGVLAALALVAVSRRRAPVALVLGAVAAAVFGVLVGLDAADAPEVVWFSLPALAVIAAQAAAMAGRPHPRWASVTATIADIAASLAAAALVLVWLPGAALATGGLATWWFVPAGLSVLAALSCAWRDRAGVAARAGALGAAPWAALAMLATGLPWWASATAVVGAAACAWVLRSQPRGFARLPELAAGAVALLPIAAAQEGWWTSLQSAGVRESDVALAVVAGVWALGGAWIRSRNPEVRTWFTSGPALALLGGQLLATYADSGQVWRALAALVLGVVAAGVGGWKQESAPLVLGTAITLGAVLVLSGDGLAAVPVWAWLLIAGAALLGLAVLVERRGGGVAAAREVVDVVLRRYR